MNELFGRTSTTILIAFAKAKEDTGQLVYKVDGSGKSSCDIGSQKCQVDGLLPGTAYSFTVKACIKVDKNRCGDPTHTLATSTLPNGSFLFILKQAHIFYSIYYGQ